MISGIIKVEVSVISRSRRLRLITLTEWDDKWTSLMMCSSCERLRIGDTGTCRSANLLSELTAETSLTAAAVNVSEILFFVDSSVLL